jgi:hypothetical protein
MPRVHSRRREVEPIVVDPPTVQAPAAVSAEPVERMVLAPPLRDTRRRADAAVMESPYWWVGEEFDGANPLGLPAFIPA